MLKPLILLGYRCTGKTTVGRLLARALGRPFADTDELVETQWKTTIAQMVAKEGWDAFRARETLALKAVLDQESLVVATGGGLVLSEENRQLLKAKGFLIWLQADARTVIERMRNDAASLTLRPDLTGQGIETETVQMLALRTPLYQELADLTLDTAVLTPDKIVNEIMRRMPHERL